MIRTDPVDAREALESAEAGGRLEEAEKFRPYARPGYECRPWAESAS